MRKGKYLLVLLLCLFKLSSYGQVTIEMEEDGGVYKVPCKVNGLRLKFIFDTGASTVSISSAVAEMMLENDYLSEKDFVGSGYSQIANGSIVDHTIINLKEIEIGGLKLNNIEAIVIHNQSAPLLLGQSAIQKIGRVTISGNQLIISNGETKNPYLTIQKEYSEVELDLIYKEALQEYLNGNYILALEKYEILHNAEYLYLTDVKKFAQLLVKQDRAYEALDILFYYEDVILDRKIESKVDYYDEISYTAYEAKEYNTCIRYGKIAQSLMLYPIETKWLNTYWISRSYFEIGKEIEAKREITNFISDYLRYMEISATDCWDKEYKDTLLGRAYSALAFSQGATYLDGKKYYIISAAWGNKGSIEICNDCGWTFSNKPLEYAY